MATKNMNITEILEGFHKVLDSLTEKERSVITRRMGFETKKETLQQIGDRYGITRERVRQIEDVGIQKIGRIMKVSNLAYIQEKWEEIVRMHGNIVTRDRLVSALIAELWIEGASYESILDIMLQSDFSLRRSKPKLGTHTYFYFPEVSKKMIESIHKEAVKILKRRWDIMEMSLLYETIRSNLFAQFGKLETIMIDSIMDVYIDIIKGEKKYIGLEKWKILNPSTLKDKAVYVLKKEKEPMHFMDISNKITEFFHEPVKISTIHNELIRNDDFVLIGRGIYVLKDWGYQSGTVLDVILDIFKKAGEPLSTDEITARVLKKRQVKKTTIYMNLQNKKYIERVGRNLYQAKA